MPRRLEPPLPSRTRKAARELRARATDAESRLWMYLRADRLNGLRFRRQHPVPPYIVDFYCAEARLAIELDGSQHTQEADAARTRHLERAGIRTLRFWDHDVLIDTDAVLEAILIAIGDRTLSPTPLPPGEGL